MGSYQASHLQRYVEDPEDEPSDPEELAELDRLLFEISDSVVEKERRGDGEEAREDSNINFDWGLGDINHHLDSDSGMGNRVRLRTRSYYK